MVDHEKDKNARPISESLDILWDQYVERTLPIR